MEEAVLPYSSSRFAVLIGKMACHDCKEETPVSALLLPGKGSGDADDERMDPEHPVLLNYITQINSEAEAAWVHCAPWVKWVEYKTAGTTYLANTCVRCTALQGDWFIAQPGAPFFPTSRDDARALSVEWVDVSIVAVADGSQSTWMDELDK